MINDFSTRLKYFRSLRNLTQTELAIAVDISRKQISDYEVERNKPRQTTYLKILTALEVSQEVFESEKIFNNNNQPNFLKIPLITWLQANHFNSIQVEDQPHIYIDDKLLNLPNVKDLFALKIMGMSMYPKFKQDDHVFVDVSLNSIEDGQAYIVSINDEATIKTCFKLPDGKVQLDSNNLDFPVFQIEQSSLTIIGKVVFKTGAP